MFCNFIYYSIVLPFIVLQVCLLIWLVLYFFIRDKKRHSVFAQDPEIAVLIPVKNEGKVIADTINYLLKSNYKNKKIYVIDDGSTDKTPKVLEKFKNKVKIITNKVNSGSKAKAINRALKHINSPLTVILDGDTVVTKKTFHDLVAAFDSDKVAAVSSVAIVKNESNLLTLFQAVDYIIGMFFRLIQDKLRAAPTTVGVCTAVLTDVLKKVGGMPVDTLTEDGDLCAILRKEGYICRVIDSVVKTHAPEKISILFKQRKRWTQGRIQVEIKHFDMIFNPKYGLFGVVTFPYEFILLVMLYISSPILLGRFIQFVFQKSSGVVDAINVKAAGFQNIFGYFDFLSIFSLSNFSKETIIVLSSIVMMIPFIYIFFALKKLKLKHKLSYYFVVYFSSIYISFMVLVAFYSLFSEIYNRISKKQAAWGTK